MSFSINFLRAAASAGGASKKKLAQGVICLGDFQEQFAAELTFWSISDYEHHWRNALARLLRGSVRSCLITSISNPELANFITWWPIYRAGDLLHVQNQNLLIKDIESPFDAENPYSHIPPREIHTASGGKISEWNIVVDDVRLFLNSY